ncbi:hypothetical protein BGX23_003875 [Mortierella sp. AD031]|nr:hypothetical protein BGX23_003875 [Mortierella sp. AD031]
MLQVFRLDQITAQQPLSDSQVGNACVMRAVRLWLAEKKQQTQDESWALDWRTRTMFSTLPNTLSTAQTEIGVKAEKPDVATCLQKRDIAYGEDDIQDILDSEGSANRK